MSSEMAKKRGRPKKLITELMEVEMAEVAKQTTRAKSTKAAPKTVKAKASSTVKKLPTKATIPQQATKPAGKPAAPVIKAPIATKAPIPTQSSLSSTNATIRSGKDETKTQNIAVNPPNTKSATTSPILGEVQKLKEQQAMVAEVPKKSTQPSPSTPQMKASPSIPESAKPVPHPAPSNNTPPPSSSNPTPPGPRLPIAALNSAIVSNISTRAGARPNTSGSKQLPQNYKAVSRKVTMAIVAMPVVIVTSYVLYQRLVLGEERKHLVNAEPVHPTVSDSSV